jgi:hypothetical protein
MADVTKKLETDLRVKVGQFLTGRSHGHSGRRQALLQIVSRIRAENWNAVLFGGTLRDLMIYGGTQSPRDIDIVFDGVSSDEIAALFADCIVRRTRFGGLHLQYRAWMFDMWSLADTWALKSSAKNNLNFEDLPKTTFLNVEAVAADLIPKPGRARQILSHGFFEAISERVLDINHEENPFPTLCVVRTLVTAARLRFSISRKLCAYLVHYSKLSSAEELVDVQLKHYGTCRRTAAEFQYWINFVATEYRNSGANGVMLPVPKDQQLKLFSEWTPAW